MIEPPRRYEEMSREERIKASDEAYIREWLEEQTIRKKKKKKENYIDALMRILRKMEKFKELDRREEK